MGQLRRFGQRLKGADGWSNAAISVGSSGASKFLAAVAGVVVARTLGPAERGELAIVALITAVGSTILLGGVQFWVIVEMVRTRNVASLHRVVNRHLLGTVGVAVVGACAATAAGLRAPLAAVTAVAVVAAVTSNFTTCALQGLSAFRTMFWVTVSGGLTYFAGVVLLAATDVISVAATTSLAAAGLFVGIGIGWYVLRTHTEDLDGRSAPWHAAFRFGASGGVGELLMILMQRADMALVAMFCDPVTIGVYAVAVTVSEACLLVPQGLSAAILPKFVTVEVRSERTTTLHKALLLCAGWSSVVAFLSLFAIPIVYGDAYRSARGLVAPLAVGATAFGYWMMVASEAVARDRVKARPISTAIGLSVTVACGVVIVPAWGGVGGGVASAAGYLAAAGSISLMRGEKSGSRNGRSSAPEPATSLEGAP